MVLSVGGLVGVLDEWAQLAEKHGCRILVPSGAIAGLDGMKGAREAGITSVVMETRKPPRGLAGAPWIERQHIDLGAITTETLIFEGPATEAVKAFPANVNVVAAVSLATIGPEKTRIKIYADARPGAQSAPRHHRGRVRASHASRSRTYHRRIRARGSSPTSPPSPCSGSWGRASRSETSLPGISGAARTREGDMVKGDSDGYHSATPYLIVDGAARALDFYKRALRREGAAAHPRSGDRVGHAEIKVGDSVIMLADEHPEIDGTGGRSTTAARP
jgi:hypothetical protein